MQRQRAIFDLAVGIIVGVANDEVVNQFEFDEVVIAAGIDIRSNQGNQRPEN